MPNFEENVKQLADTLTHKDLDYRINEIHLLLKNMDEKIDRVEKKVDIVDANQKYTNGKVKKIELWKAGVIGGGIVIMGIVSYLGFTVKDVVDRFSETSFQLKVIDYKIADGIDKALEKYNINYTK